MKKIFEKKQKETCETKSSGLLDRSKGLAATLQKGVEPVWTRSRIVPIGQGKGRCQLRQGQ